MNSKETMEMLPGRYTTIYVCGMVLFTVVLLVGYVFQQKEVVALGLLGGMCPIVFSLFNCMATRFFTTKFSSFHGWAFNAGWFVGRFVFMGGMTYLGIRTLELPANYYIITLTTVWYVFHKVEASHAQSLINAQWKDSHLVVPYNWESHSVI